jgi:hypothetical protein
MSHVQRQTTAFALAILLIAACVQTPPSASSPRPPAQPVTRTIQVISDLPGARIEVNNDYVGDAPLSILVPEKDGNFTIDTAIRATPTQEGQYVQSKWFSFGSAVPSRILFTMGLGPAQ